MKWYRVLKINLVGFAVIVLYAPILLAQAQVSNVADIATISKATVAGLLDPNCLDYCITGVCIAINCQSGFCLPETSFRVKHRLPDLVITAWSGEKAGVKEWQKIIKKLADSLHISSGLSYGRSPNINRNVLFKEALVFGNPADLAQGSSRPICKQVTKPLFPYMSSHLDHKVWRNSQVEGAISTAKSELLSNRVGSRRWSKLYPRIGYSRTYSSTIANYITAHRGVNVAESKPLHFLSATGIPPMQMKHQTKRTSHSFADRLTDACWQSIDGSINATASDSKCEILNPDIVITDHFQTSFAALLWTEYQCCLPLDGEIVKIIDLAKPLCYD